MYHYIPNHPDNITLQMEIPLCLVGWMIGRGGSKLLDIQARSMCYILMNQNVPDEQPRILSITGFESNARYAFELVQYVLSNSPLYKEQMLLQAQTMNDSNDSISSNETESLARGQLKAAIVECPCSLLGLLIGKNGWTLKKIIRTTGAKVTINQSVGVNQPRRIIIYGSDSQVINASTYINRIVNKGLEKRQTEGEIGSELESPKSDASVHSCSDSSSSTNTFVCSKSKTKTNPHVMSCKNTEGPPYLAREDTYESRNCYDSYYLNCNSGSNMHAYPNYSCDAVQDNGYYQAVPSPYYSSNYHGCRANQRVGNGAATRIPSNYSHSSSYSNY